MAKFTLIAKTTMNGGIDHVVKMRGAQLVLTAPRGWGRRQAYGSETEAEAMVMTRSRSRG